jgi:hypothetical protein
MYLTMLYSRTYLFFCQTSVYEFPKEYLLSMFEEMVIKRAFAVNREYEEIFTKRVTWKC